ESLMDESETISLDDYEGQIVVLNSWGQWCAPCRAEVDDLQRIQEDLEERDLGTVLGINVRDYNPQIARDFKEDNGVPSRLSMTHRLELRLHSVVFLPPLYRPRLC